MQLLSNSPALKINSSVRGQDSVFIDICGGIWEGGGRFENVAEAGLVMNLIIKMVKKMGVTNQSPPLKSKPSMHRHD